jgi:hypothetical protein
MLAEPIGKQGVKVPRWNSRWMMELLGVGHYTSDNPDLELKDVILIFYQSYHHHPRNCTIAYPSAKSFALSDVHPFAYPSIKPISKCLQCSKGFVQREGSKR